MEKLIIGAVKAAEAFDFVVDRVGMHQVHEHGQPHAVGGVDEGLEIFGRAEAGGRGEKAGDVVSEGSVVWMLLNSHELYCIVSGLYDSGKYTLTKFFVCSNFFIFSGHTNMSFINDGLSRHIFQRRGIPLKGIMSPDLGIEYFG